MKAADISVADFVLAAYRANLVIGYASSHGVHAQLERMYSEPVPFKVVLAKLDKLDRQGIIEGCDCGCSSPLWLVDGKHEHNGLNRLVDWDNPEWVGRVMKSIITKGSTNE